MKIKLLIVINIFILISLGIYMFMIFPKKLEFKDEKLGRYIIKCYEKNNDEIVSRYNVDIHTLKNTGDIVIDCSKYDSLEDLRVCTSGYSRLTLKNISQEHAEKFENDMKKVFSDCYLPLVLTIEDSYINDFNFLVGESTVGSSLILDNVQVKDYNSLSAIKDFENIVIKNSDIDDISFVEDMDIEFFYAKGNLILWRPCSCSGLEYLGFDQDVTNITFVDYEEDFKISSEFIQKVFEAENTYDITFKDSNLRDVDFLLELESDGKMIDLHLDNVNILKYKTIAALKNIRSLTITNCDFEDTSFLNDMELEELVIE